MIVDTVVGAYGSRSREVLRLASQKQEWCARVADGSPVIAAELVWAVRNEMAVTLSDAVIRRTPLGALGYPGDKGVEKAADIVGRESAWSDERRRSEIEAGKRFYQPISQP